MIRDEMEKLIQDYSGLGSSIIADRIISLIESKLPEVEEECVDCKQRWRFITHDCPTCNGTGKTTRRMSLDEGIEWLRNHNAYYKILCGSCGKSHLPDKPCEMKS